MRIVIFVNVLACVFNAVLTYYVIDDSVGFGRSFNGIGAISGGGATSKLLVNYPESQRSEILDYLFKPNFGASLHIFKVEIGGDIQSTDGTEASHMHYGWDEDYTRGYEWWMLQEAKKRNPNIKLYGLPWGFPGWLRDSTDHPWKNIDTTADYVVKWINGAKVHYNLTIDYIGIWNESPYNITYIKTLRKTLDMAGFKDTLIIATDQNGWKIADDMAKDQELADVIYALGSHYPKTKSDKAARETGKPLWASEETVWGRNTAAVSSCSYNRNTLMDVWTWNPMDPTIRMLRAQDELSKLVNRYGHLKIELRVINLKALVQAGTIFWNIITSYYPGLPDYDAGLMKAVEPWSGNYEVKLPIWMTAHTTQFTEIGWKYFKHGYGVGNFTNGGTYVTLTNPEETELTIIIETYETSKCTRTEKKYELDNSSKQSVVLQLKGKFSQISSLNVWYSQQSTNVLFERLDPINVTGGAIPLTLQSNGVWTLTTLKTGNKGSYPNVPNSKPFPLPYIEDFEGYRVGEEPFYFSQQIGSFETAEYDGNKFMQQVVIDEPVHWFWCHVDNYNTSLNVFGDYNWKDITTAVYVQLHGDNTSDAVFLAVRATNGGCKALNGSGLFLFFYPREHRYMLTTDLLRNHVVTSGTAEAVSDTWNMLTLETKGDRVLGAVNSELLFNETIPKSITNGWVALGTYPYGIAWFDDFQVREN